MWCVVGAIGGLYVICHNELPCFYAQLNEDCGHLSHFHALVALVLELYYIILLTILQGAAYLRAGD